MSIISFNLRTHRTYRVFRQNDSLLLTFQQLKIKIQSTLILLWIFNYLNHNYAFIILWIIINWIWFQKRKTAFSKVLSARRNSIIATIVTQMIKWVINWTFSIHVFFSHYRAVHTKKFNNMNEYCDDETRDKTLLTKTLKLFQETNVSDNFVVFEIFIANICVSEPNVLIMIKIHFNSLKYNKAKNVVEKAQTFSKISVIDDDLVSSKKARLSKARNQNVATQIWLASKITNE